METTWVYRIIITDYCIRHEFAHYYFGEYIKYQHMQERNVATDIKVSKNLENFSTKLSQTATYRQTTDFCIVHRVFYILLDNNIPKIA
jgi:hypothetical protein